MYCQADIVGTAFDWCSKFSVNIVWGNNLSHNLTGNVSSTPARTDLKWLLKVWIARSARFLQWLSLIGSCNFSWFSFLNSAEALLSKICVLGFTVLDAVSCVHNVWYALIIDCSDLFFIGSASIKFPLTSTSTIIYWFPLLDVARNRPVWSVCIVSVALWISM